MMRCLKLATTDGVGVVRGDVTQTKVRQQLSSATSTQIVLSCEPEFTGGPASNI